MREYSPQNISVLIKSGNETGEKIDVVCGHMCDWASLRSSEELQFSVWSRASVCECVSVNKKQTLTFSFTLFGPELF